MLEVCFSAHPNIQYRAYINNRRLFMKKNMDDGNFYGHGIF